MSSLVVATPVSAAIGEVGGAAKAPAIEWQECPEYSDEDLRRLGVSEEKLEEYRQLLGRTECGTISVPLDYDDPAGKQISIALTRLKAADQKHRRGSLAFNPGGPGGSGYLMPHRIVTNGAELDERYDLIGIDPRGVGSSTKVACPEGQWSERPPGPVTEEHARKAYAETVKINRECAQSNPEFLEQVTAANVARDIDRIRAALGEPKISFLAGSWGAWLGAVLGSLFPGKVDRMWLDSVAPPDHRRDTGVEAGAKAAHRNFQRMAAWIAARDDTYGFGTTTKDVVAALEDMQKAYDADPLTFTDIGLTVDGTLIAEAAVRPSTQWPRAAQVLKELVDAEGPTAPPAVKEMFGPQQDGRELTANRAFQCNEELGERTFESWWNAYLKRVQRYPVTGRTVAATPYVAPCAGWPLPAQKTDLRPFGGSLMLSGHLHESMSPYESTPAMREAIGGTVVTIDDDVHGSAFQVPGCIEKLVDYFETGKRTTTCPGMPLPESAETRNRV
ncbi:MULTISPECIES: alpha/beta fold hydrolase [unclassified Nonomuraea]|uniref:alpha/beta fold hydrolase n=1 Tax=unclassified Nonomuraea TaxID=2593643 RepID=UPI001F20C21F|nr:MULTISPECIES: alpha/beta fold hydrolase [unclassified Nonomuraea]